MTDGIRKLIALSLRDIYERSGRVWGREEFGSFLRGMAFGIDVDIEERVWDGRMTDEDCSRHGPALHRVLLLVRCMLGGGSAIGLGGRLEEVSGEDFRAVGLDSQFGGDSEEVAPPGGFDEGVDDGVTGNPVALKKERVMPVRDKGRVIMAIDGTGRSYVANEKEVARELSREAVSEKTQKTRNGSGGGVGLNYREGSGDGESSRKKFSVRDMVLQGQRALRDEEARASGRVVAGREREEGLNNSVEAGEVLVDLSEGSMNRDVYLEGANVVERDKPSEEYLRMAEMPPPPPPVRGFR